MPRDSTSLAPKRSFAMMRSQALESGILIGHGCASTESVLTRAHAFVGVGASQLRARRRALCVVSADSHRREASITPRRRHSARHTVIAFGAASVCARTIRKPQHGAVADALATAAAASDALATVGSRTMWEGCIA